jgi:hypothetical protein
MEDVHDYAGVAGSENENTLRYPPIRVKRSQMCII